MTEYDFSPEAYQHHLAKMDSISRWVDDTERNRSQFTNAAALSGYPQTMSSHRTESTTRRQAHPPLPHDLTRGFGLSRRRDPLSEEFAYFTNPGLPGPMPTPRKSHDSQPFSYGYGHPISPPPVAQYSSMPPGYINIYPVQSILPKKSRSTKRSSKSTSLSVSSFFGFFLYL